MRDTRKTLDWYRKRHANPPFDPDGMCLKICRVARGLPPLYPSAVAAQNATPAKYRITNIAEITRGMVVYYDDPRDNQPYGHVVTVAGRRKDADRNDLSSLIVWTNGVKRDKIVAVRGDYFPRHWGDEFQFAATWLNGEELDLPRETVKPPLGKNPRNILGAIEDLEKAIAYHEKRGHNRLVKALKRDVASLQETIKEYSR